MSEERRIQDGLWAYWEKAEDFNQEDYEWLMGRIRDESRVAFSKMRLCIYRFHNGSVVISTDEHPSKPDDLLNVGVPKWQSR